MMQTERIKRPQSVWVNNLDFAQREVIAQLYGGGMSISAIARIYQVHHSSIRYHLVNAGVYVKGRQPGISFDHVKRMNLGSSMIFKNRRGHEVKMMPTEKISKDLAKRFVGVPEHERNFPQSYAEYLQRDLEKQRIRKQNESTHFQ